MLTEAETMIAWLFLYYLSLLGCYKKYLPDVAFNVQYRQIENTEC